MAAGAAALQLVLTDAHAQRVREAARAIEPGKLESWPLRAILRVWVYVHISPEWVVPDTPDGIPAPSQQQLCDALLAAGAFERKTTSGRDLSKAAEPAPPMSLPEALRGSPLEGAFDGAPAELPEDAVEMVLLWGIARCSQKGKLRMSTVRAAGSDTSWIDRQSKNAKGK